VAVAELYRKRDEKVREHLKQYAPVWLQSEKIVPSDEAVIFEVLFQHNLYGWTVRRYKYDGFNNVLYHMGQVPAPHETIDALTAKEPWISTLIADIPHAYGG
jgi:hypothetical protein